MSASSPDAKTPEGSLGDVPVPGSPLHRLDGYINLPALVFGAGAFSGQYNTEDHLTSDIPLNTVRLALRYGINAFDTSVYYGPSEIVLGHALKSLETEFPRSTYQLMTKCGRYGCQRSLSRLQTSYLDTVYLHDVEYLCTPVAPRTTGNHVLALSSEAEAYGLAPEGEATIHGKGDQRILDAFRELQRLKSEGLIKHIGLTVDVVLNYSNLCLHNTTFADFAPLFYTRAQVGQLLAASPMSMGLLTASPPAWHPAPPALRADVVEAAKHWPPGLPNISLGYSMRHTGVSKSNIPLVVGFSTPSEVHEAVRVWREIQGGLNDEERRRSEAEIQDIFRKSGFLDWSWASP
ncbi:NADP-dependent oxidoreductase domain-containing protein [Infundibulicybe gibba]|nr:NADP-dependent oxidoreductase domain-containing protein [Infundibulicybe gibba]